MYLLRLIRNAINTLRSFGPRGFAAKTRSFINQRILRIEEPYDQNESFLTWLEEYETEKSEEWTAKVLGKLAQRPKISILIPVYNPERDLFEEAIDSVFSQTYENWELCLSDDASTEPWVRPYLENLGKKHERIKVHLAEENKHIAVNTNRAAQLATGDYFLLMDNDDLLPPYALLEYARGITCFPCVDLLYGDEYKKEVDGTPCEPWFRTDYNPELEYSMCPYTHSLISKKIFEEVGGFRKGYEGAQDYDLFLRITEKTQEIRHIPEMLYIWRKVPGSTAATIGSKPYAIQSAKRAVREAAKRRGIPGKVSGNGYPLRLSPAIEGEPTVEVIIPTKNADRYLRKAICSIEQKTEYAHYSVTVINHQCDNRRGQEYLEAIDDRSHYNVVAYSGRFNFSRMNNEVVRSSGADVVVFMNDDIEILEKGWLKELVRWATLPFVGAVGTLLIYPSHFVQHAGIVLGVGGVANHAYSFEPVSTQDYFNHIRLVRNCMAVTGALMAVSREKFREVDGFNEESLPVSFQDVDLCLRLWNQGYRTVYTPWAMAIHHESVSRGRASDALYVEEQYMQKKWGDRIEKDPFYNIHFERGTADDRQKTYRIGTYHKRDPQSLDTEDFCWA